MHTVLQLPLAFTCDDGSFITTTIYQAKGSSLPEPRCKLRLIGGNL